MRTNRNPSLVVHRHASRAGLIAAVLAASSAMTGGSAMAAIICNAGTVPIAVPATTAGVYLNLVTGATGTSGSGTAGWDVNIWASSGNIRFYSTAASGSSYVGTGTVVDVLAAGTMIDASSTFNATGTSTSPGFQAGVTDGYFGVRFLDQASATRYGWVRLTTTGTTGFPANMTAYCYQDDGTGIQAGTTPVSLQNFSVD